MKTALRTLFVFLSFVVLTAGHIDARDINVFGTVRSKSSGKPVSGVYVFNADNKRLLGVTNIEGKYLVTVDDSATLEFSLMGYQTHQVPIFGQLNIDVDLTTESKVLSEVVVQAKRSSSSLITEPTDLNVKGNYLYVKTHVKMPHEMFDSGRRLIIQPMVFNDTRKEIHYLTPIVFDGWRYADTQERRFFFNPDLDPLTPWVDVKQTGAGVDDILHINDSVYVEQPHDSFRMDLYMSIEDYNKILYDKDITIARGVVNPLRFLESNLDGFIITDPVYLPTPDLKLREGKGDINLTFRVGKYDLDLDLGNNREELDKLLAQLHAVEDDPNSMIKNFSITGTASPEGSYRANMILAKRRIDSAMAKILQNLEQSTRKNAKLETTAMVETWDTVAKMLMADSLFEEAQQIQNIIENVKADDRSQSQAVARLPIFKMLKDNYLTRLRRVSYEFASQRYRFLTDEEIAAAYKAGDRPLSQYELWRLYTLCDSLPEKEAICERAVKEFPDFFVGINDLTAIRMARGEYDSSMLEKALKEFTGEDVPEQARATLAAVYLNEGRFQEADSVVRLLPRVSEFQRLMVYNEALNGRYMNVINELSEESLFTEVLLLLAIKANEQAWVKAQELGNTAKEEYIKAVAANRLDYYLQAIEHLENAFALDPKLKEIAKTDGDVIDLLEEEYGDDWDSETTETDATVDESASSDSASSESKSE